MSNAASFKQLFEPCLRNIPLIRLGDVSAASKDAFTTLGDVVFTSRYIAFAVVRSSVSATVDSLRPLVGFVDERNANIKPEKNPTKFRRLFGLRKSKKKSPSPTAEERDVAIVLIDLDFQRDRAAAEASDIDLGAFGSAAAFGLPPVQYLFKSRLLRSLGAHDAPSVVLLDTTDLTVLTAQGRVHMNERATAFPWKDPPVAELFAGKFVRSDGGKVSEAGDFSQLDGAVKGIYFGAKWCPPCRSVTKQLSKVYERIRSAGHRFEIIFCSFDRSAASFGEHLAEMPWCAWPYDSEASRRARLTFDVSGIPALVLLDADNRLITKQGKSVLLADPTGTQFPWPRQPLYELTEHTVQRIAEMPTLIMFTEGSPEDTEFAQSILRPCAQWLFGQLPQSSSANSNLSGKSGESAPPTPPPNSSENSSLTSEMPIPVGADPIQVFYTGENPICDYILDSLDLGQVELPLLMICDLVAGHMALCDKPDVGESTAFEFVNDYRAGRVNVQPLPSAADGPTVGGIPMNVIAGALQSDGNPGGTPVETSRA